jgi:hypothetical protein
MVSVQVTGRAMVRPVRLGMVFEPSLDILHVAVEHATLFWGGIYQPFLDPRDLERLKWDASRLGVDALWALDATATSAEAAGLIGYQWRGRGIWSPLAAAQDFSGSRLLGPERLLGDMVGNSWTLPRWVAGDPLEHLFSAWFGSHGISDQGVDMVWAIS